MLASPGRPWLHPSASTSLRRGSCPVAPHRPGLSGPQRHRRRACARTTAASAVPSTETTTAPPAAAPRWEAFAERAAGEWDGVTATFSADGEPQPLPDYYVPQASAGGSWALPAVLRTFCAAFEGWRRPTRPLPNTFMWGGFVTWI